MIISIVFLKLVILCITKLKWLKLITFYEAKVFCSVRHFGKITIEKSYDSEEFIDDFDFNEKMLSHFRNAADGR